MQQSYEPRWATQSRQANTLRASQLEACALPLAGGPHPWPRVGVNAITPGLQLMAADLLHIVRFSPEA